MARAYQAHLAGHNIEVTFDLAMTLFTLTGANAASAAAIHREASG
jgi:hypothetical protein